MPQDAPLNGSAPDPAPAGSWSRVAGMQAKLHRWAAADPGRRFDDLFNFVHDPATLVVAFGRVAGNHGANTPGVDGLTAAYVEEAVGVPGFLDDLRAQLKTGTFRPLPVRERKIPKPGGSGKLRKLGIPCIADRVVQAALKLVLEPIFEADFEPVSYGFRPMRRAHDAIAEIHQYGTQGYRWVLDADIEAAFDNLSHSALMDRVRARVKDKRVLALVKAFLKAGVLTETGGREDTHTGTPQGGILAPNADSNAARCHSPCRARSRAGRWWPARLAMRCRTVPSQQAPGPTGRRRCAASSATRRCRRARALAPRPTLRTCAKTSRPTCWRRWACGYLPPRPRWCT